MDIDACDIELQYGIQTLQNEQFLVDCGIVDEGECSVHMSLDGGKRKRKKKVYTTPKKIGHKHKKRPKALLEYFQVDDASGKVKRLKQESPAAAGAYMAEHPDRYTCGRTGTQFFKLTADGKRLPIPKQNKPAAAAPKAAAKKDEAKKAAKKKK
jgi:small subunit ribosomal protein S27Ae